MGKSMKNLPYSPSPILVWTPLSRENPHLRNYMHTWSIFRDNPPLLSPRRVTTEKVGVALHTNVSLSRSASDTTGFKPAAPCSCNSLLVVEPIICLQNRVKAIISISLQLNPSGRKENLPHISNSNPRAILRGLSGCRYRSSGNLQRRTQPH